METKPQLNIAIDIETLSTQPTAAIIAIAAKVFTFDTPHRQPMTPSPTLSTGEGQGGASLNLLVNAASCAMHGMHFDMDTVKWWKKQSEEAKAPYMLYDGHDISIILALDKLHYFVEGVRNESHDKKILVWMQGTDFDAAILKNAFHTVMGWNTPWKHNELRDARTYINAMAAVINPENQDPYSMIPKNPNWKPHQALSDVEQLVWNVRHMAALIQKTVPHPKLENLSKNQVL